MSDAPSPDSPPDRLPAWLYLALLLCAPVAYEVGQTLAVSGGPLQGLPLALVAILVTVATGVVLAVRVEPVGTWSRLAVCWFGAVLLAWAYLSIAEEVRGDGTTWVGAALLPIVIVVVWRRRPATTDVWRAMDLLAWSVVVGGLIVLALEAAGLLPSWYRILGGIVGDLAAYDRQAHGLVLGPWLGLDGRWGGFLRDPNLFAPIAAALTVYGFTRRGTARWVFVIAGSLFLLLTDSRTAFAAASAGLILLLVLPGWGVGFWRVTWPKAGAVIVGLLFGVRLLSDLRANPAGTMSMTGRTSMWPDFMSLAADSPWLGVGTRAIREAAQQGLVPSWAITGHNQAVDTIVRYGWVGLVLVGLVVVIAISLGVRGAMRGRGLALALMGTLTVSMVGNLLFDPRYLSPAWSWLLGAVLLAETRSRSTR